MLAGCGFLVDATLDLSAERMGDPFERLARIHPDINLDDDRCGFWVRFQPLFERQIEVAAPDGAAHIHHPPIAVAGAMAGPRSPSCRVGMTGLLRPNRD